MIVAWLIAVAITAAAAQDAAPSVSSIPETVVIPAGPFVMGSDRAERDAAYALDRKAYGHWVTREQRWYESEGARKRENLPVFTITRSPITNRQYQTFIRATRHPAPDVDEATWNSYQLIHPYTRTRRHAWRNGAPPEGRLDHPIVLVSRHDAQAYADWLSAAATGETWRLPSEAEWEKAARGADGRRFPWGDTFDPRRLNSHDAGPFDTTPVGMYPRGASPFGVFDAAGQVYEWTATSSEEGRSIVKGGSWDDKGCGVCRPAARHARPDAIKHILIGFRLVRESRDAQ